MISEISRDSNMSCLVGGNPLETVRSVQHENIVPAKLTGIYTAKAELKAR